MSVQTRNMLSLLAILLILTTLPADEIDGRVPFRITSCDEELNSKMIEQKVIDAEQFEEHYNPLQRSNYPEQNLNRVIMILANAGPDLGRIGKSELVVARGEFKGRVETAMKSINELFENEKVSPQTSAVQ
ncbi:hypothetical protein [Gimesia sp.]|uniref:hypothetical protein n=1 Tax=Gimesia sp. TaxID=2024833 RepID=UPI003A918691